LVFHLQDIIPNPIKLNFNIVDFFLGYYFLPVGSFIQDLTNISGSEENTKIELPENNMDKLNS
jgi:hypothetical protein